MRLADRSLTQTNPLLAVVGQLLDLAGGRAEASRVLDLVASDPVRRRFRFTDNDLETLTGWVEKAGIRWAFDEAHREPFGLERYVQNTWRFGLDRVLAGVAVSDDADRFFGTTLPLDDVGSTTIDLAGRLAELLDRLQRVTDALTGSHPVAHWLDAIGQGVDQLTAVARDDEWQTAQVHRELASMVEATAGNDLDLRLPDVRALMRERLAGRPTRANFRTGTLTVATLVPMRSVPHRVVCLLGLDDGVFPRAGAIDGDDVLARRPFTGERDARSEDRQLMLDAIVSATEHLVVTYTGANETTGAARPPAVPLGELLDALDATATGGRAHALRRHPLQAFDPRNLDAAAPFSFDAGALAGARATLSPRTAPEGLDALLLPPRADDVELAVLTAFLKHPVKEFLRRRLEIALADEGEEVSDGLPVELDGLAQWGVGDRMLRDLLLGRTRDAGAGQGVAPRRAAARPARLAAGAEDRRPGGAGRRRGLGGDPGQVGLRARRRRRPRRWPTAARHGHRPVRRARRQGDLLPPRAQAPARRVGPPAGPRAPTARARSWSAGAIGRGGYGRAHDRTAFASVDDAPALLADLVALYDAGMREPLPAPAQDRPRLGPGQPARCPRPRPRGRGPRTASAVENEDPAHVRVWGPGTPLEHPARAATAARRGVARPAHPPRRPRVPAVEADPGACTMSGPTDDRRDAALRPPRRAADRHHPARGQRRHRQDVRRRRAGHPLRRRGRGDPRPDAGDHLRPGGQPGAARAGPRAARRRRPRPGRPGLGPRRSEACSALLADVPDAEVALRRRRVRDALADFDAATIATTHQFCQMVLRSLGVAGDTDSGAELVDDLDELVVEVVDDVYLQRFGHTAGAPPFNRAVALELARSAVGDPQAVLAPADADPGTPAAERRDFAGLVRDEVDRRKRRLGILSYDDLLVRLADALEPGADGASPARERMRERWRIVLVDEFQDTDPVQWAVLDRAFSGAATMVLIGDPKQAIYAFRGGDIVTYLAAAETAGTRRTLATNWRSDQPLVEALQALLGRATLGDPRIAVHPVRAQNLGSRLRGAPAPEPLRVRLMRGADFEVGDKGTVQIDALRAHVAQDLADDVARLLASEATFDGRPVEAGDVAVLIFSLKHVGLFQDALTARGIPSVVTGGSSVLLTEAGEDWLTLLEVLEQPHRAARVRSVALTPFVGHTAEQLDAGGDALTDDVGERARRWLDLLRARGIAAVHEAVVADGLAARVLATPGGERRLTDLTHLAQVLHEVSHRERLGLPGLLEWLRAERRRAVVSSERTRRLDTDARAVQFVTIHASKGLQYPVVHLPLIFDRWVPDETTPLFHDETGRRALDVGGSPGTGQRRGRAARVVRRGAASDLRRPDPRPEPGGHLVGAELERRQLRAHAAPAGPVARPGRGAPVLRPWSRPTRPSWPRCAPGRPTARSAWRSPSSDGPRRRSPGSAPAPWACAASTARSTWSGAAPPTPA